MTRDGGVRIASASDAVTLLREAVPPDQRSGEIVFALDAERYLLGVASRFDTDAPALTATMLRLIAEELRAAGVMLVTFVDADHVEPRAGDVARLEGLRVECSEAHVDLVDHVLMHGHVGISVIGWTT